MKVTLELRIEQAIMLEHILAMLEIRTRLPPELRGEHSEHALNVAREIAGQVRAQLDRAKAAQEARVGLTASATEPAPVEIPG